MKSPTVSVVMPFWNRSGLITNSIKSIMNQTVRDWELIIVDDGSDEGHAKSVQDIVNSFADERIRIVRQDHKGIAAARNLGNEQATAPFLTMQDSDDLAMPDRLEKCLDNIGGADILYHGMYMNTWDKQFNCITRDYIPARIINIGELLEEQRIPSVPFYRRHVWRKRPFRLETTHAFDWMMYVDWKLSGFEFKAYDVGLYEYIRQEGSSSIVYRETGLKDKALQEIRRIVKEEYGIAS